MKILLRYYNRILISIKQSFRSLLCLKGVAIIILLAFVSQQVAYASPQTPNVPNAPLLPTLNQPTLAQIIEDPSKLNIPLEFVCLEESHRGTNGKLIIHIQDAHSNLSGQQSLSNALNSLLGDYDLPLILSEGGSKDASLSSIRSKMNPKDMRKAAKRLLFEGLINGQEYLDLTSTHAMQIIGIEKPELYLRNLEVFAELKEHRQAVLSYLRQIKISIERIKNKLYPEELLKLEQNIQADTSNELQLILEIAQIQGISIEEFDYIQQLNELKDKEALINFERANLEQQSIIDQLSPTKELTQLIQTMPQSSAQQRLDFIKYIFQLAEQKNIKTAIYSEMQQYRDYLLGYVELDLHQVIDEINRLKKNVYAEFLKTSELQTLRASDEYLELLIKAYQIQMTSEDYTSLKFYQQNVQIQAWQAFLNQKLTELNYFDDLIIFNDHLEKTQALINEFYSLVHQRDLAFMHNTERVLQERGQNAAFMIAGGYHTQHLTDLFKQEGYSYVVLSPRIEYETNQAKYENLLLAGIQRNSAYTLSQALAAESNAAPRMIQNLSHQLNGDASVLIEHILKLQNIGNVILGSARMTKRSIETTQSRKWKKITATVDTLWSGDDLGSFKELVVKHLDEIGYNDKAAPGMGVMLAHLNDVKARPDSQADAMNELFVKDWIVQNIEGAEILAMGLDWAGSEVDIVFWLEGHANYANGLYFVEVKRGQNETLGHVWRRQASKHAILTQPLKALGMPINHLMVKRSTKVYSRNPGVMQRQSQSDTNGEVYFTRIEGSTDSPSSDASTVIRMPSDIDIQQMMLESTDLLKILMERFKGYFHGISYAELSDRITQISDAYEHEQKVQKAFRQQSGVPGIKRNPGFKTDEERKKKFILDWADLMRKKLSSITGSLTPEESHIQAELSEYLEFMWSKQLTLTQIQRILQDIKTEAGFDVAQAWEFLTTKAYQSRMTNSVEQWVEALGNEDEAIRREAVQKLIALDSKPKDLVLALEEQLSQSEYLLPTHIIALLAVIQTMQRLPKHMLRLVSQNLRHANAQVRGATLEALLKLSASHDIAGLLLWREVMQSGVFSEEGKLNVVKAVLGQSPWNQANIIFLKKTMRLEQSKEIMDYLIEHLSKGHKAAALIYAEVFKRDDEVYVMETILALEKMKVEAIDVLGVLHRLVDTTPGNPLGNKAHALMSNIYNHVSGNHPITSRVYMVRYNKGVSKQIQIKRWRKAKALLKSIHPLDSKLAYKLLAISHLMDGGDHDWQRQSLDKLLALEETGIHVFIDELRPWLEAIREFIKSQVDPSEKLQSLGEAALKGLAHMEQEPPAAESKFSSDASPRMAQGSEEEEAYLKQALAALSENEQKVIASQELEQHFSESTWAREFIESHLDLYINLLRALKNNLSDPRPEIVNASMKALSQMLWSIHGKARIALQLADSKLIMDLIDETKKIINTRGAESTEATTARLPLILLLDLATPDFIMHNQLYFTQTLESLLNILRNGTPLKRTYYADTFATWLGCLPEAFTIHDQNREHIIDLFQILLRSHLEIDDAESRPTPIPRYTNMLMQLTTSIPAALINQNPQIFVSGLSDLARMIGGKQVDLRWALPLLQTMLNQLPEEFIQAQQPLFMDMATQLKALIDAEFTSSNAEVVKLLYAVIKSMSSELIHAQENHDFFDKLLRRFVERIPKSHGNAQVYTLLIIAYLVHNLSIDFFLARQDVFKDLLIVLEQNLIAGGEDIALHLVLTIREIFHALPQAFFDNSDNGHFLKDRITLLSAQHNHANKYVRLYSAQILYDLLGRLPPDFISHNQSYFIGMINAWVQHLQNTFINVHNTFINGHENTALILQALIRRIPHEFFISQKELLLSVVNAAPNTPIRILLLKAFGPERLIALNVNEDITIGNPLSLGGKLRLGEKNILLGAFSSVDDMVTKIIESAKSKSMAKISELHISIGGLSLPRANMIAMNFFIWSAIRVYKGEVSFAPAIASPARDPSSPQGILIGGQQVSFGALTETPLERMDIVIPWIESESEDDLRNRLKGWITPIHTLAHGLYAAHTLQTGIRQPYHNREVLIANAYIEFEQAFVRLLREYQALESKLLGHIDDLDGYLMNFPSFASQREEAMAAFKYPLKLEEALYPTRRSLLDLRQMHGKTHDDNWAKQLPYMRRLEFTLLNKVKHPDYPNQTIGQIFRQEVFDISATAMQAIKAAQEHTGTMPTMKLIQQQDPFLDENDAEASRLYALAMIEAIKNGLITPEELPDPIAILAYANIDAFPKVIAKSRLSSAPSIEPLKQALNPPFFDMPTPLRSHEPLPIRPPPETVPMPEPVQPPAPAKPEPAPEPIEEPIPVGSESANSIAKTPLAVRMAGGAKRWRIDGAEQSVKEPSLSFVRAYKRSRNNVLLAAWKVRMWLKRELFTDNAGKSITIKERWRDIYMRAFGAAFITTLTWGIPYLIMKFGFGYQLNFSPKQSFSDVFYNYVLPLKLIDLTFIISFSYMDRYFKVQENSYLRDELWSIFLQNKGKNALMNSFAKPLELVSIWVLAPFVFIGSFEYAQFTQNHWDAESFKNIFGLTSIAALLLFKGLYDILVFKDQKAMLEQMAAVFNSRDISIGESSRQFPFMNSFLLVSFYMGVAYYIISSLIGFTIHDVSLIGRVGLIAIAIYMVEAMYVSQRLSFLKESVNDIKNQTIFRLSMNKHQKFDLWANSFSIGSLGAAAVGMGVLLFNKENADSSISNYLNFVLNYWGIETQIPNQISVDILLWLTSLVFITVFTMIYHMISIRFLKNTSTDLEQELTYAIPEKRLRSGLFNNRDRSRMTNPTIKNTSPVISSVARQSKSAASSKADTTNGGGLSSRMANQHRKKLKEISSEVDYLWGSDAATTGRFREVLSQYLGKKGFNNKPISGLGSLLLELRQSRKKINDRQSIMSKLLIGDWVEQNIHGAEILALGLEWAKSTADVVFWLEGHDVYAKGLYFVTIENASDRELRLTWSEQASKHEAAAEPLRIRGIPVNHLVIRYTAETTVSPANELIEQIDWNEHGATYFAYLTDQVNVPALKGKPAKPVAEHLKHASREEVDLLTILISRFPNLDGTARSEWTREIQLSTSKHNRLTLLRDGAKSLDGPINKHVLSESLGWVYSFISHVNSLNPSGDNENKIKNELITYFEFMVEQGFGVTGGRKALQDLKKGGRFDVEAAWQYLIGREYKNISRMAASTQSVILKTNVFYGPNRIGSELVGDKPVIGASIKFTSEDDLLALNQAFDSEAGGTRDFRIFGLDQEHYLLAALTEIKPDDLVDGELKSKLARQGFDPLQTVLLVEYEPIEQDDFAQVSPDLFAHLKQYLERETRRPIYFRPHNQVLSGSIETISRKQRNDNGPVYFKGLDIGISSSFKSDREVSLSQPIRPSWFKVEEDLLATAETMEIVLDILKRSEIIGAMRAAYEATQDRKVFVHPNHLSGAAIQAFVKAYVDELGPEIGLKIDINHINSMVQILTWYGIASANILQEEIYPILSVGDEKQIQALLYRAWGFAFAIKVSGQISPLGEPDVEIRNEAVRVLNQAAGAISESFGEAAYASKINSIWTANPSQYEFNDFLEDLNSKYLFDHGLGLRDSSRLVNRRTGGFKLFTPSVVLRSSSPLEGYYDDEGQNIRSMMVREVLNPHGTASVGMHVLPKTLYLNAEGIDSNVNLQTNFYWGEIHPEDSTPLLKRYQELFRRAINLDFGRELKHQHELRDLVLERVFYHEAAHVNDRARGGVEIHEEQGTHELYAELFSMVNTGRPHYALITIAGMLLNAESLTDVPGEMRFYLALIDVLYERALLKQLSGFEGLDSIHLVETFDDKDATIDAILSQLSPLMNLSTSDLLELVSSTFLDLFGYEVAIVNLSKLKQHPMAWINGQAVVTPYTKPFIPSVRMATIETHLDDLGSKDKKVRDAAEATLIKMNPKPEGLSRLLEAKLADNPDGYSYVNVIAVLKVLASFEGLEMFVIEQIASHINDTSKLIRQEAVRTLIALAKYGDVSGNALSKFLTEDYGFDSGLRIFAIKELAQAGYLTKETLVMLKRIMRNDPSQQTISVLLEALPQFHKFAVDIYLEGFSREDDEFDLQIVEGLGKLGVDGIDAIDTLKSMIDRTPGNSVGNAAFRVHGLLHNYMSGTMNLENGHYRVKPSGDMVLGDTKKYRRKRADQLLATITATDPNLVKKVLVISHLIDGDEYSVQAEFINKLMDFDEDYDIPVIIDELEPWFMAIVAFAESIRNRGSDLQALYQAAQDALEFYEPIQSEDSAQKTQTPRLAALLEFPVALLSVENTEPSFDHGTILREVATHKKYHGQALQVVVSGSRYAGVKIIDDETVVVQAQDGSTRRLNFDSKARSSSKNRLVNINPPTNLQQIFDEFDAFIEGLMADTSKTHRFEVLFEKVLGQGQKDAEGLAKYLSVKKGNMDVMVGFFEGKQPVFSSNDDTIRVVVLSDKTAQAERSKPSLQLPNGQLSLFVAQKFEISSEVMDIVTTTMAAMELHRYPNAEDTIKAFDESPALQSSIRAGDRANLSIALRHMHTLPEELEQRTIAITAIQKFPVLRRMLRNALAAATQFASTVLWSA